MKLDSIVYDYSSLQSAITEQLNNESPTFQAMYPSDTATSLVNVLASYGSMLQYQLLSAMANAYTDTAYSETGIYQLAETLGNRIHGNISAQVYCNITRTNLTGIENLIIPAGSKFTVESLNFFNPQALIFPLSITTLSNINLVQGVLLSYEQTAQGISGEKIYFCDDFKCNTNMVHVYVDDEEWDITDSFLPYVVTETSESAKAEVCVVKTDSDGRTYVKFGNNSNGLVPSKGKTIKIEYVSNEGANGNLNDTDLTIDLVTPIYYTTSDNKRERLTVDITAITTASGGFDTQSIETLKESSPLVFASGDRAIRRNDYKAMLLNKCGYLTANVWGEYEEATIQGGYDKIMMNMVYYTGIKAIQKYDLQPVMTLQLSPIEINNITSGFYTVEGNVSGARGFLGSYVADISSYDTTGSSITLKYRDSNGTGILTCDPSINAAIEDLDTVVFPVNDLPDLDFTMGINQKYTPPTGTSYTLKDQLIYGLGGDYTSTGIDTQSQPKIITFDNPFQIKLDFAERTSLTALAFKTPSTTENYGKFMHKFAVYGTNVNIPATSNDTYYENVKNSSTWVKLTGLQTIDTELSLSSYSDWYTTKVYNPGTSTVSEEDLSSQCATTSITTFTIHDLINDDYTYSVKIDGETVPTDKYYISGNNLVFTEMYPSSGNAGKTVILSGTLYDWTSYEHYLIEIYSVHDSSLVNPKQVSLGQIKGLIKKSSSTINYTDNNSIILKLPVTTKENTVTGYTKPVTTPLTSTWLNDELGNQITPSILNTYIVKDNCTHNVNVELLDPGAVSTYHVNDEIFLPYHTHSVAVATGGSGYAINETFEIDDKAIKITNVTTSGPYTVATATASGTMAGYVTGETITINGATGETSAVLTITATDGAITALTVTTAGSFTTDIAGTITSSRYTYTGSGTGITLTVTTNPDKSGVISGVEFIGPDKYTNENINQSGKSMDAGSYSGEGAGATFNITSSIPQVSGQSSTYYANLSTMAGVIKLKVKTIEDGYITEVTPTEILTLYDPTTTNIAAANVYAFDMTDPDNPVYITATKPQFKLTSTPELTLYNDNIYKYASNSYYAAAVNPKFIGLPDTMQYYEYTITLNNITETNGYRTGNTLTYSILSDNITYVFTIQIANISTQSFGITLQTDGGYASSVLRGKSSITINNANLTTVTGTGSGGTISISAKSTVNVYCSYTGNFYTDSDIQAADLPVINKYNHFTTYLEFRQPHIKNVTIEMNVEYENVTNYQTVKNNIITAVNSLFDIQPYSIGSTLNASDIWKAVNSVEGVKRFNVITPLDNIDSNPYELLALPSENLIINDIINSEYK